MSAMSTGVVPDLLRHRVASIPDHAALMVETGRVLTYREWDRRSNAAARGLAARGVGTGGVVVLVFDGARWDGYAVAYLAAHKAGAAAVPLSPGVAGPELGRFVEHSGAAGVVCAGGLAPDPPAGGAWVAPLTEVEEGQGTSAFQASLEPSDLAEIIYTSGTTGTPKAVACSHASIIVHDGPPEPEGELERLLHAFPVGTNACQEVLRISLRRSDRLPVALHRFDPERCAAAIEEHRPSRLQLVPAMAQALVASDACQRRDVSSVEVVVLSSAPAPPALLTRLAGAFPRARLVNTYALTEAGTARTLNPDALQRPDSVGRPVGRTELRVVDETGGPVPEGRPGEILLRRPGAPAREYFRDPAATAAVFAEGWLRTGDLGWVDGQGELHLVDRSKDVIICGGLNVASVEVENVLYQHPEVLEAAVFGLPHEVLGQQVAAAVVATAPVEARELQDFLRQRLAEHKVPYRVTVVDQLPRTLSGKVRKTELAGALASGDGDPPGGGTSFVAPSTPAEESVAAIWAEVLGVREVGIHDDFFERGGHSLAAAQVVMRLEDAFGVALPMSSLFERPTVAELASLVAA